MIKFDKKFARFVNLNGDTVAVIADFVREPMGIVITLNEEYYSDIDPFFEDLRKMNGCREIANCKQRKPVNA